MMLHAWILLLSAASAAEPVTLDEALDTAFRQSPLLGVSEAAVDAAQARADATRGYLGPSVTASGAALWWNDTQEAAVVSGDICAELGDLMELVGQDCEASLGELTKPILLREQQTQMVKVEAKQPLTPLYQIVQGWNATRSLVDAAEADLDHVRATLAGDVVEAWVQALEVEALGGVAEEGVRTLEGYRERVAAFHAAGMVGRNELLQVEVALSGARLDLERARTGLVLARRRLAQVTGADARVLVPAGGLPAPEALPSLEVDADALGQAALRGPQVRSLEAKVEAAQAGRRAAEAGRLPQVAALGTWERDWGLGEMSLPTYWYVGVGFDWDVWSWGQKHYAAKEAAAQAAQAEAGLQALRDGVGLQAEAAFTAAALARRAVEASGATVEQTGENLRIVQARFDAHTAPSTDLLEARVLDARARADRIAAVGDYVVAVARLQAALGLPVRPLDGVRIP